jgi:hypothetical protein
VDKKRIFVDVKGERRERELPPPQISKITERYIL